MSRSLLAVAAAVGLALALALALTLFVRRTPEAATGTSTMGSGSAAVVPPDVLRSVPGDGLDEAAASGADEGRVAVSQPAVGEPEGPHRSLWGRVLDGDRPVPEFVLWAERLAAPLAEEPVRERFEDEAGSFELDLPAGRWRVHASTGRRTTGEPVVVDVPVDAPFVLRLVPLGSIAGVVLDPFGTAAVGATVTTAWRRGSQNVKFTTARDGSFELLGLDGGEHELVATLEGFAPSEPLRVLLPEGEHLGDQLIALRVGARIHGRVLDRAGRPEVDTTVSISSSDSGPLSPDGAKTDAAGAFEFADLAPGTWRIGVENDSSGGKPDGPLRMEVLELAPGDDVEIVLGGLLPEQVHVRGVALAADGTPLERADLVTLAEGEGLLQSANQVELGAGGRFDVTLAFPGRFVFALDTGGYLQTFHVQVPPGGLDDLRLVLPGGRIAGRVLDPSGAPAGGVMIGGWRSEGAHLVELLGQARTAESQEDGHFVLTSLPPGSWWLAAEGGDAIGRLERPVVLAPGGILEGIELRLATVGGLEAVVVGDADGEPVAGATVFARDAGGHWVLPRGQTTNGRGEAVVPVPAGRYTLIARAAGLASFESEPVDVLAEASTRVELVLVPATRLEVALLDSRGALLPARFRVEDAAGRVVSGLLATHAPEQVLSEGFSSLEPRFGPFAPGPYRVVATTDDDRATTVQVAVSGEPLQRVELRLE